MPVGVDVSTVTSPAGGSITDPPAAAFFVAGLTQRGSVTDAIPIRSMTEARQILGDRVTYGSVDDALACYFGEGGTRAYVARVVGAAATSGTLTLQDATPASTLRINASNPGSWSSDVTVEVQAGLVPNTVKLIVRYLGAVVETYDNLASSAAAASALAVSGYVVGVDLGGALPAVASATALSAGSDDRGSVTSSTLVAALSRFTPDLGTGIVAIPGQSAANVATGIGAHATANRRLGALALPASTTAAAAVSTARTLRSTTGAENLGLFWPNVAISDGAGGTRLVTPEGAVAGMRARHVQQFGPGHSPAGAAGIARFVTGLGISATAADVNALADDAVNPFRPMLSGIRLYGWRSLSANERLFRWLTVADVLNEVATRGQSVLERFVEASVDPLGHVFLDVAAAVGAVIEPLRASGALAEKDDGQGNSDAGYLVDAGPSVNTTTSLASGLLKVRVAVRPAAVAEHVVMTLSSVALTADLTS